MNLDTIPKRKDSRFISRNDDGLGLTITLPSHCTVKRLENIKKVYPKANIKFRD